MSDNFELIDAHIHLFDYSSGWHPHLDAWTSPEPDPAEAAMGRQISRLKQRDFLWDDYRRVTCGYSVLKSVYVTCASAPPSWPAETEWVQNLADEHGAPNGIIGWTDFQRPLEEVAAELDQHATFGSFRGLRHHQMIDYADDHNQACIGLLQERGLVYDLCAHEAQLPVAAALVERFGDMTFVLEHLGWPTATDQATFSEWRSGIQAVAGASANVAIKISGFGMMQHDWIVDDLRPWVEAAIDAFGVERCIFGSNFPVDRGYADYGQVVDAVREVTSGLAASEQRALFVDNAECAYRI